MNCTIRVVKTKALISFAVTAKLICAFVFAYADCWFSHEAAHLVFRPAKSNVMMSIKKYRKINVSKKLSQSPCVSNFD